MTRRGDGSTLYAVHRLPGGRGAARHLRARRWQRISLWTLLAATAAWLTVSLLVTGLGVRA